MTVATPLQPLYTKLHARFFAPAIRPLRFAGAGSAAGALQLLLLTVLSDHGWEAMPANGVAFLVAAQLNFALSLTVTWRDRIMSGSLVRSWMLYHGSIALMALVNMLTFAVARTFMPILAASMTGIAVAAAGNYVMGDRVVFRHGNRQSATPLERINAA